jgi:hypothetical protein
MATLYDEIKALDEGVAYYYQEGIKNGGELDEQAVQTLFAVAYGKDGDISPMEDRALQLIWDKARISAKGKATWQGLLNEGAVMQAFGKGGATRLKTNDQLMIDVFNAIGSAQSSVNFIGPKTMISYDARQYLAMKELILAGDIQVYDLKAVQSLKGMTINGSYDSRLNTLFLLGGAETRIIVHELTHAIQDWNDLVTKNDYSEADAYIAQGLVERTLPNNKLKASDPFYDVVNMVLAGDAKVNNPAWNGSAWKPGVYDTAAASLRTHPNLRMIYQNYPIYTNYCVDEKPDKNGKWESDRLRDLVKKRG